LLIVELNLKQLPAVLWVYWLALGIGKSSWSVTKFLLSHNKTFDRPRPLDAGLTLGGYEKTGSTDAALCGLRD